MPWHTPPREDSLTPCENADASTHGQARTPQNESGSMTSQNSAQDRTARRTTRDLLEPRPSKRGRESCINKRVGLLLFHFVGITFNDPRATLLREHHRCFQKCDGHPTPSERLCHKETGHRPDWTVV